jgi:protein-S-isoprenylcysteine O-methyltransferase Ste14
LPLSTAALPSQPRNASLAARLARWRVTLGFVLAAAVLWLAHPTWKSLAVGGLVAIPGEAIRFWAAGHLERWQEVTRSGPYRWTSHPLYLGSSVIGAGLVIASNSVVVAAIIVAYLAMGIGAAIRSEEAGLREQFGEQYVEYKSGRSVDTERPFSLARAIRNRELRAVGGLAGCALALALKVALGL